MYIFEHANKKYSMFFCAKLLSGEGLILEKQLGTRVVTLLSVQGELGFMLPWSMFQISDYIIITAYSVTTLSFHMYLILISTCWACCLPEKKKPSDTSVFEELGLGLLSHREVPVRFQYHPNTLVFHLSSNNVCRMNAWGKSCYDSGENVWMRTVPSW